MRRWLSVFVAVGLVGIALLTGGCSSSKHSSSKPKVSLTKLKTILLTATELPVTGYTAKPDPGIDQTYAKTAIGHYDRTGDTSVLSISLIESVTASDARRALGLLRQDDGGLVGVTTAALPFGTDGRMTSGTDKITKDPEVDVTLVQGASIISVSLVGRATPALSPATVVDIARRQNYKYIALAK